MRVPEEIFPKFAPQIQIAGSRILFITQAQLASLRAQGPRSLPPQGRLKSLYNLR